TLPSQTPPLSLHDALPILTLPPVTVLKPLKGPGIDLYDNLASFCRLDYPAYQIVFGVEDVRDPAVAVVRQIRRDFPDRDIVLSRSEEHTSELQSPDHLVCR